jgi:hypothetical protein
LLSGRASGEILCKVEPLNYANRRVVIGPRTRFGGSHRFTDRTQPQPIPTSCPQILHGIPEIGPRGLDDPRFLGLATAAQREPVGLHRQDSLDRVRDDTGCIDGSRATTFPLVTSAGGDSESESQDARKEQNR